MEENAEDIKSDENSEEEEKEINDENSEEENKWIVPDGHLSQDEVSEKMEEGKFIYIFAFAILLFFYFILLFY